jgi:nucleoid DNA-binding protein
MNIFELSKIVAKETGEPVYKINKIICATIRIIRKEILKAQIVKLTNLLTIFVDVVPEKTYHNGFVGEFKKKPRRFALKIIPSKKLKKEVDAKKTY